MGCMLAVVFGLVGAVLASIVRANIPGQHHAGMDFLLFICSGVFTIPLGYFIGEAIEKVQRNKEETRAKAREAIPPPNHRLQMRRLRPNDFDGKRRPAVRSMPKRAAS